MRILLHTEVKVLCDLKESGDDSQELEDDIKATRLQLREALVKERQVLSGEYFLSTFSIVLKKTVSKILLTPIFFNFIFFKYILRLASSNGNLVKAVRN